MGGPGVTLGVGNEEALSLWNEVYSVERETGVF